MDQLTRDCIAARNAGMTYGKWMALHYVPPVIVIPQEEVEEPVPEVKEEKPKRLCRTCGKEIKGHANKRYCDDACKYEAFKVWQRERYHRKKERMMADGKIGDS